jgi:hypothetical protein
MPSFVLDSAVVVIDRMTGLNNFHEGYMNYVVNRGMPSRVPPIRSLVMVNC